MKTYFEKTNALFIIVNLVFAIVALSFIVDAQSNFNPPAIEEGTLEKTEKTNDLEAAPAPEKTAPSPQLPSSSSALTSELQKKESLVKGVFHNMSWDSIIKYGGVGAGVFSFVGSVAGGKDGGKWGAIAGGVGGAVAGLLRTRYGDTNSILIGGGIAAALFLLTYKKEKEDFVEFSCLPWQAPIGGENCQLCNEFEHCSEYMCKSLGQACDIVNAGTSEQACIWKNPQDVNSPLIRMVNVSGGHKIIPNNNVRPPATGVIIEQNNEKCIRAFYPLSFTFTTRDIATGLGEPSQCKIDYNLTRGFNEMQFYVGGDETFSYNHTEKLSLPAPSAIAAVAPEIKNDGEYTLFIRCQDANGNFNQDAYSVSFCVDKGPDTTPPLIVDTNVPTGNPISFNQTKLDLQVYVNEPSECKWSREDRDYTNMENTMQCSTNLWEMNNRQVYTCKTTLTGLENRKENNFYFKCKDQPWSSAGDRNENKQSYKYTVIGTQSLTILAVSPNQTIFGATDTIPVFLEMKTDNGFNNGEALCYYYNDADNRAPANDEAYVLFHETQSSLHQQRQDLKSGEYVYYFKCIDLGGNAAYTSTKFKVATDRAAPQVVRAYHDSDLTIITDETASCSYSHTNCNFEIESGIQLTSTDFKIHHAPWDLNKKYFIRCKDTYGNQPNPNACSILVRPSLIASEKKDTLDPFDFSF